MTDQLELNYQPHAHRRRSDPDTSREAAHMIESAVDAICGKLLAAFRAHGAMTRNEVARHVALSDYQVSKRLSDLKNAGLLIDSGLRRAGSTGRQQIVWRAL